MTKDDVETVRELTPEDVEDLRGVVDIGRFHAWTAANVELGQLAALLDAWEERERLRGALVDAVEALAELANLPEVELIHARRARAIVAAAGSALAGREG